MGLAVKTDHIRRYKDIVWLLLKYGRHRAVRGVGAEAGLPEPPEVADPKAAEAAEALAGDLERMGPTFIKFGQLLSSRSDLVPPAFVEGLSRLQDDVEPVAFEDIERTVTTELGLRLSKAFATFESVPLASASLGQVHRATLRNGREVVVKVQRPDIREKVFADIEVLEKLASFLDAHTDAGARYEFRRLLDEFRKSLTRELDYRQEARNLVTLADNLKEFEHIVVPRPIDDYTTSRVLTFDFVRGAKVTDVSPLFRTETDGAALADELFRAYLKQILIDGFVHADPHPGNVLLTPDGKLALLDLGMVARLAPGMQERLLQLLLAVSEGRGEEAADLSVRMGETTDWFDEPEFRREVAAFVTRTRDARLDELQSGRVLLGIAHTAGRCGIRVPVELTMLGKALLSLDQVGRVLDPRFDPNDAVRRYSTDLLRRRVVSAFSPSHLFGSVLEVKNFLERLPGRFNDILDHVARNDLSLKVDAIDETALVTSFEKVANRITMGLILAALIVGAALLMRVDTTFRIFGYPGLAMVCFLAAAGGGVALMVSILLTDHKRTRHPPTRP
jgi:predicted unusual protein kinase regulating ubiquinone biosynthesis (AarF/ABC1/UbiB family)